MQKMSSSMRSVWKKNRANTYSEKNEDSEIDEDDDDDESSLNSEDEKELTEELMNQL